MMEPAEICLFYATHDGHTRKIVDAMTYHIESTGKEVAVYDLGKSQPNERSFMFAPTVIIIAPIRYGSHLPAVDRFVRQHKGALNEKRLVVVSVNLTARKQGKNTPELNPYLRKWVKRSGLKPSMEAVFGGRLEYALYSWWEKQIIRLIMRITGGPTNFDAAVDFTDWGQVDVLAHQIAATCNQREAAA